MTLKLGKRSYYGDEAEHLGLGHFHQLKRPFMDDIPSGVMSADASMEKNLKTLCQKFPTLDSKVLSDVLEECENNLGLSVEVIIRQQNACQTLVQPNSENAPPKSQRSIRKIMNVSEPKPIAPEKPMLETRSMVSEESNMAPLSQNIEDSVKDLSLYIIEQAVQSNTKDEAIERTQMALREFLRSSAVTRINGIAKTEEENKILKRAFVKQYEKAKANEQRSGETQRRAQYLEDEMRRLRAINYELLLRLAALDAPTAELRDMDIC